MSTNFQIKRLKLNLDIVEKPENRVHKLTDSNVSLLNLPSSSWLSVGFQSYNLHKDVFINGRTKYPLFVSRTLDFYF